MAGRVTREHTRGEQAPPEHAQPGRRAAGELEAEVLAALWAADGPLTAAHVRRAVSGGLAYNTVQTIL
ncbi:MAG: BlaI/MecI/CopY family transcriptional regulator, partial [Pseudonocardiaceae bacterium]